MVNRGHITSEQRKINRKISHSVIEKRRREKTNDCLNKLKLLVPACSLQPNQNIQKLTIMELTVTYIYELQQQIKMLKSGPVYESLLLSPTLTQTSDQDFRGITYQDERMKITSLLS
ncbi:hypothetical protein BC833DRAFT_652126 [Globomyces pollinis-pini]|nr:hypothetical protein BC833DRAFT_652126 [Globomyces pollinis-pini]